MSELLEKLQAELEALRKQVTRQEVEINQLKSTATPATGKKTTSRRKMLTQLGVAAAGVATLGALNQPNQAEAAPGTFDSSALGTDALTAAHTVGGTAIKATSSGGSSPTPTNAVNVSHTAGGVGIKVVSNGGSSPDTSSVGINAQGVFTGVAAKAVSASAVSYGIDAIATGANGIPIYAHSSYDHTSGGGIAGLIYGVKSEVSSGTGMAVYGVNMNSLISNTDAVGVKGEIANAGGYGVIGLCTGSNGYGLAAEGGRAPFYILPNTTNDLPPTSSDHNPGEFYVTKDGSLYYCVARGLTPTWQKIAPTGAGGPVILAQPQRAIEAATVGYGAGTPSAGNNTLKVVALAGVANLNVPTNCKVFGTITVYPDSDKHMKVRPGLGKVTVWKKDVAVNFPATVANLTFPIGGIGSSFFMVEITGANKEFNLASNVNTTFAVDILGYFG